MSGTDHNDDLAARRRRVRRTVGVLAAVAVLIYAVFIGRGVFGS